LEKNFALPWKKVCGRPRMLSNGELTRDFMDISNKFSFRERVPAIFFFKAEKEGDGVDNEKL